MKKFLLLVLFSISLTVNAQSLVVELYYNVNGYQHSTLCVLNGNSGKCNVLSEAGNCWYDAYYSEDGAISAIAIQNPSVNGWIPGVFYFTPNRNYVVFQGYTFELGVYVVPNRDWSTKMAQYGFSISNTSFRGGSYVEKRVYDCNGFGGSHCSCKIFKGYKVNGAELYYGDCQNYVNGHTCGHSAAAHGLPQKR